jgi:hypothetical protein
MTTTTNDQSQAPRRRRPALPSVSEVEALINNARALRLKLVQLAAFEPLTEPAKEAGEWLSKTGLQLERIIELIASTKRAGRRRTTKANRNP